MDKATLGNLMRLAVYKTGAERALALDADLAIVDSHNLNQADLLASNFVGIEASRQALETGEVVITNNLVKDQALTPTTNTTYRDLRFVVVVPVGELGTIYLDQAMRLGAIPRAAVQGLSGLAAAIANADHSLSEAEMEALYKQLV